MPESNDYQEDLEKRLTHLEIFACVTGIVLYGATFLCYWNGEQQSMGATSLGAITLGYMYFFIRIQSGPFLNKYF